MSQESYILAIDEGTTCTTSLLIDREGQVVAKAYREVHPLYPQPGWVEQDPLELLEKVIEAAKEAIQKSGIALTQIKGIGITNQRETTIVWDRHTGKPVSNAIVWQCRRTAPLCEELKRKGFATLIKEKTGLVIDAYFSATKLRWILDNIPDGQKRAQNGDLLFGTVDAWLVWNLTGGAVHITDYSNASRTMLFNIHTLQWDRELLAMLDIPESVLPEVVPSSRVYGETIPGIFGDIKIPISGIAGDQQASLFGQACYGSSKAKNTYGTGSFILLNTGNKAVNSESGLLTTIAWGIGNKITYALEGSIFVTGAAVQWLRDGLKIISKSADSEVLAGSVPDNGGVYLVPAFVGLGAPYWDMYARGIIVGLTRGTTAGHIARATLEAIAYQTKDVIEIMEKEAKLKITNLRADGGGTASSLLMQFQSDILGIPLHLSAVPDITATGAGYLAGLAVGLWKNTDEISRLCHTARTYEPKMSDGQREMLYNNWKRAVERSRDWVVH
ncbi:MAG: glycerol kinase GlpK [Dehalococcoidales bacterium]|nr:glycerol kinase GlpK [Dehalococcoidales bacterium]